MPLRQQSPEGFVGFVRVVGHGIEHKQIGGICRLVVVDDHLNALFVHASLPPLHPQEHAWVRPRYGSVRSRASAPACRSGRGLLVCLGLRHLPGYTPLAPMKAAASGSAGNPSLRRGGGHSAGRAMRGRWRSAFSSWLTIRTCQLFPLPPRLPAWAREVTAVALRPTLGLVPSSPRAGAGQAAHRPGP